MSDFNKIAEFEQELEKFTGAPYAIMTDCCTHAIELCMRYAKIKFCSFPAYTYLSIPMTMLKLDINFDYIDDKDWVGEYQFDNTNIWDSARLLRKDMYRDGQMQCLSFGHGKPLEIGRGGAILLDDETAYTTLLRMRYDGRDLDISPWQEQHTFNIGYHYKPTPEEAIIGLSKLPQVNQEPVKYEYPDLRNITIKY
jgi:dTDP-4-amino-4,6-dideoxygalactose transaminase